MLELLVLFVGILIGAVLLWQLARQIPQLGAKLGLVDTKSPSTAVTDALADIRATDSELAQQIAEAPAVEPSATPFVVEEKDQSSPLTAQMLERIPDETLRRTLRGLLGWRPRSRSGDEHGYVNSMLNYLGKGGIASREVERERRIYWSNKSRWAQPDVIIADRVLVEVKADLGTSSASDRSLGQMLRYLLAWKSKGPAILIVCGRCDPLMSLIIRQYVDTWRTVLRLPVTVWFVRSELASSVDDRVYTPEPPQAQS